MKPYIIIALLVSSSLTRCLGAPTVQLNNIDANMPIDFLQTGTLPGKYVIYVSVIAHNTAPVHRAGTTGEDPNDYIFKVDENGFFDAGVGVVPGAVDGQTDGFRLAAVWSWNGEPVDPQFEGGVRGVSQVWSQPTGSWDPKSGLPVTGPVLQVASSVVVGSIQVPETNALTLTMFGGVALLTNSVLKAVKHKPAQSTVQKPKPK